MHENEVNDESNNDDCQVTMICNCKIITVFLFIKFLVNKIEILLDQIIGNYLKLFHLFNIFQCLITIN